MFPGYISPKGQSAIYVVPYKNTILYSPSTTILFFCVRPYASELVEEPFPLFA